MPQSEESRLLLPPVRIMEKESHLVMVDKFSERVGIGMGNPVASNPFVVGGYSFSIQLYPDGSSEEAHRLGWISAFIKNESPKPAHFVYDLHFLDPADYDFLPYGHFSFDNSFGVKGVYHQLYACLPGSMVGYVNFTDHYCIRRFYGSNGSILIKATIGVIHDHAYDHQQLPLAKPSIPSSSSFELHRCIVFQVGDEHFFEKESVITKQCPALISEYPQSNHNIVVSDMDPDVFKSVLWYLNTNMIGTDFLKDGVVALNMLAAADKLHLKSFRFQMLNCLVITGNLHVLYRYSELDHIVKELRRKVSRWLPQKIKAL